jgi:hypothetical protein
MFKNGFQKKVSRVVVFLSKKSAQKRRENQTKKGAFSKNK